MTWWPLALAGLTLLAIAGGSCYQPEIGDGTLSCFNDQCPRGF